MTHFSKLETLSNDALEVWNITDVDNDVLAQEVLEVKPDAVTVKDGYYAVDYSKVM